MKRIISRLSLTSGLLVGSLALSFAPAYAVTRPAAASANANSTTRLQRIISRGDKEIERRLKTLNRLSSKVPSGSKLSDADKSNLTAAVQAEITDLTNLKTKLDADTDVNTAASDALSIITEYRVYALIVPKIQLVRAADAQQVAEAKLTVLAGKLQTSLSTAQSKGQDISTEQALLTDMNAKIAAAQAISSQVGSTVLGFQPNDRNSNPSLLSGYRDQLQTAQADIRVASNDAQSIINFLK
ncbi:MAG TPA: hypothetical protein VHB51_01855 [Candidatus Saccharimonadales bacterium]|nr:hypothetical protein [Candidatus Saccharimonadales bacterium]